MLFNDIFRRKGNALQGFPFQNGFPLGGIPFEGGMRPPSKLDRFNPMPFGGPQDPYKQDQFNPMPFEGGMSGLGKGGMNGPFGGPVGGQFGNALMGFPGMQSGYGNHSRPGMMGIRQRY